MFQPPAAHSCCPRRLLSSASQSPKATPPRKKNFFLFLFCKLQIIPIRIWICCRSSQRQHTVNVPCMWPKQAMGEKANRGIGGLDMCLLSYLPSENMEEKRERENKQRQEARKRLTVGIGWGKRTVIEYKHGKCDGAASGSWSMCHVVRGKRFPPRDGGRRRKLFVH